LGEAEERRRLAVVFDANVIIASLVKESGLNRFIVTLTPIIYPSYYPEILRKEVLEHIQVIAQKAGRPENEISVALESILESILEYLREVGSRELSQIIEASIRYVEDEADSLYVATYMLSPLT